MSHLQTVVFQRFGIVASAADLDALAAYIVSQHPAVTLAYGALRNGQPAYEAASTYPAAFKRHTEALHAVEATLAGIPPGPTDTDRLEWIAANCKLTSRKWRTYFEADSVAYLRTLIDIQKAKGN